MARQILIAIDPGMSGAIVVRDKRGQVRSFNMPDSISHTRDLLCALLHERTGTVIMEDVGYHVMGNNASSSAKFAKHTGVLIGLVYAMLEHGPVLIQPKKWMELYGKMPKEKKDRKNALKDIAQKLYPGIKATLVNADALCIMGMAKSILQLTNKKEDNDRKSKASSVNNGGAAGNGTQGGASHQRRARVRSHDGAGIEIVEGVDSKKETSK